MLRVSLEGNMEIEGLFEVIIIACIEYMHFPSYTV
jgi:hypothetical protein